MMLLHTNPKETDAAECCNGYHTLNGLEDVFVLSTAEKMNHIFKVIEAPFYVVCSTRPEKGDKDKRPAMKFVKKLGEGCVKGLWNVSNISQRGVTEWLEKNRKVSLSKMIDNPDAYEKEALAAWSTIKTSLTEKAEAIKNKKTGTAYKVSKEDTKRIDKVVLVKKDSFVKSVTDYVNGANFTDGGEIIAYAKKFFTTLKQGFIRVIKEGKGDQYATLADYVVSEYKKHHGETHTPTPVHHEPKHKEHKPKEHKHKEVPEPTNFPPAEMPIEDYKPADVNPIIDDLDFEPASPYIPEPENIPGEIVPEPIEQAPQPTIVEPVVEIIETKPEPTPAPTSGGSDLDAILAMLQ